jgi:hypothetical protein
MGRSEGFRPNAGVVILDVALGRRYECRQISRVISETLKRWCLWEEKFDGSCGELDKDSRKEERDSERLIPDRVLKATQCCLFSLGLVLSP